MIEGVLYKSHHQTLLGAFKMLFLAYLIPVVWGVSSKINALIDQIVTCFP